MGIKIRRKSEGIGGFSLKRKLTVNWKIIDKNHSFFDTPADESIIFGDPTTAKRSVSLREINFLNFRLLKPKCLKTSAENQHKIIDGQLFKQKFSDLSDDLEMIGTFCAWAPTLPRNESLFLQLAGLQPDGVYEIALFFINKKELGATKILLGEKKEEFDTSEKSETILMGNFIAPKETIEIEISSGDEKPPFLNAYALRRTGYEARSKIVAAVPRT